jgi:hypothetical protein
MLVLAGTAVGATKVLITSSKQVKAGALAASDLSDSARASLKGNRGPAGPAGAAGSAGTPGVAGAPGAQGPQGAQGIQGLQGAAAAQIRAFAKTDACCGGATEPTNATLFNAQGITSVAKTATGQYTVTVDATMVPGGNVNSCVPLVSIGSRDAAFPLAGELSVGRPSGIPANQLLVFFRNSAGTAANLYTGGGSIGFSIALLC